MTDDSATLMARAMCGAIQDEVSRREFMFPPFWVFEICARIAQSSWAKEKAELERQLAHLKDKAELERQLAHLKIALHYRESEEP